MMMTIKAKTGSPGVRNSRKGTVDKASDNPKAVSQANAGTKAKAGVAGARNARDGKVDKASSLTMGTWGQAAKAKALEKVDMQGQVGSRNSRKGTVAKTPLFSG